MQIDNEDQSLKNRSANSGLVIQKQSLKAIVTSPIVGTAGPLFRPLMMIGRFNRILSKAALRYLFFYYGCSIFLVMTVKRGIYNLLLRE